MAICKLQTADTKIVLLNINRSAIMSVDEYRRLFKNPQTKHVQKKNNWTAQRAKFHMMCMSVPTMLSEYKFLDDRKWLFDYYNPINMTAYEYEGILADKSRHTNVKGYTKDCDKYNQAQRLGIRVYRFTALNYKSVHEYLY